MKRRRNEKETNKTKTMKENEYISGKGEGKFVSMLVKQQVKQTYRRLEVRVQEFLK
jgi:hypothetical protein